jgi:hypothetical protein
MKYDVIERVERKVGVASTLKATDFIQQYAEGVEKFIRDNQATMGKEWARETARILYNFQGRNTEGDVLGSSPYMLTGVTQFCPEISLINARQLLGLGKKEGKTNPFGSVYLDVGVQVNGNPKANPIQAKALLESYKTNGINNKEIVIPHFSQLRLAPEKSVGLVFKLSDGTKQGELILASELPFEGRVGKGGLFGVYLGGGGLWFAGNIGLAVSSGDGRVVRYDAEGVAPKKSSPSKDLVTTLREDFLKRF